jgi:hypothetical protein
VADFGAKWELLANVRGTGGVAVVAGVWWEYAPFFPVIHVWLEIGISSRETMGSKSCIYSIYAPEFES